MFRTASSTLVALLIFCSCSLRSLRRGLGPWWFAERLHGDALIAHLEDLQLLRRARRVKDHAVAWSGLHQRARQWRHPADMVAVQIDLVDADDADDPLRSSGVGVPHGRPEEDLRRGPPTSRGFRVHHF